MLSFFMILMTVSSAPLDLVNKKQSSNYVTEIMSHPRFSEVLLQNETLLSELAEADPGTLETILGLLNGLLDDSEAASVAFTTDVTNALAARVAKQDEVVGCVLTHNGAVSAVDAANLTLIGAVSDERQAAGAVTDATSDYDAAARHHTAMVDELNENQPGMDAESETLRSTIALIRTLLPEAGWQLKADGTKSVGAEAGCSQNADKQQSSFAALSGCANFCNGHNYLQHHVNGYCACFFACDFARPASDYVSKAKVYQYTSNTV